MALLRNMLLLTLCCVMGTAGAQRVRLNGYCALIQNIVIRNDPGGNTVSRQDIAGNQKGGGMEWLFDRSGSLEILYLHQVSHSKSIIPPAGSGNAAPVNTERHLVFASAGSYFSRHTNVVQGYAGIMCGASLKGAFACGARVRCTYWIMRSVGISAESQFMFTDRTKLVISPETRSYAYSGFYQATFGAGVSFKL